MKLNKKTIKFEDFQSRQAALKIEIAARISVNLHPCQLPGEACYGILQAKA